MAVYDCVIAIRPRGGKVWLLDCEVSTTHRDAPANGDTRNVTCAITTTTDEDKATRFTYMDAQSLELCLRSYYRRCYLPEISDAPDVWIEIK